MERPGTLFNTTETVAGFRPRYSASCFRLTGSPEEIGLSLAAPLRLVGIEIHRVGERSTVANHATFSAFRRSNVTHPSSHSGQPMQSRLRRERLWKHFSACSVSGHSEPEMR